MTARIFVVALSVLHCVYAQTAFTTSSQQNPRPTRIGDILTSYTASLAAPTCLIPKTGGCGCKELTAGYCNKKCRQCPNPTADTDIYNCQFCFAENTWSMWGRKKKGTCVDNNKSKGSDAEVQLESCQLECLPDHVLQDGTTDEIKATCANKDWESPDNWYCYPKCMSQPVGGSYKINMKDGTVCKDKTGKSSPSNADTCKDPNFTCTKEAITVTTPFRQTGVALGGYTCTASFTAIASTNKGVWKPDAKICERVCLKVDAKKIEGINTQLGPNGWNSLDRVNCGTTETDKPDEKQWKTEGTVCPFDCTVKGTTARQTKRLACTHTGFQLGTDYCADTCTVPKPLATNNWKPYPSNQDGSTTGRPIKSEQIAPTCAWKDGYMLAGYPCRNPFECGTVGSDMTLTTSSYGTTPVQVTTKCFDYCDLTTLSKDIPNSLGCFYRLDQTSGAPLNASGVIGSNPVPIMERVEGDFVAYGAPAARWLHGRRCEIQCADGFIRRNSPGPYCYAPEAITTAQGKGTWKWINRWGETISKKTTCEKATLAQATAITFQNMAPCTTQYLAIKNGKIVDTECRSQWPTGANFGFSCDDGYTNIYGDGAKLMCKSGEWWYQSATKGATPTKQPTGATVYFDTTVCVKTTPGGTAAKCPEIKIPNSPGCPESAVGESCEVTCDADYVKMYRGPDQTDVLKWWVWPKIVCGVAGKWSGQDTVPICVDKCTIDESGLTPTSTGFTGSLAGKFSAPTDSGCPNLYKDDDCDEFCNYDTLRLDCTTSACPTAEGTCDQPAGKVNFFTINADLKVYADRRLSKNAWVGLWDASKCQGTVCAPDGWVAAKFLTEPAVAAFTADGTVAAEAFDLVDLKKTGVLPKDFNILTANLVAQVYQDLGVTNNSLMYSSNLCAATKGNCPTPPAATPAPGTTTEDDLFDSWPVEEEAPKERVVLQEGTIAEPVEIEDNDDIDWKHPSAIIKHWMKESGWMNQQPVAESKNRTFATQSFHSKNLNIISTPAECLNTGCKCKQFGNGVCDNECNNAECNFDGWDCICTSPITPAGSWGVKVPTKAEDLRCKLTNKAPDADANSHTGALTKADNTFKNWFYEAQTVCNFDCAKYQGKDTFSGYNGSPLTTLSAACWPNVLGDMSPNWYNLDPKQGGPKCATKCQNWADSSVFKNLKVDGPKGTTQVYSWGVKVTKDNCAGDRLTYPFTEGCPVTDWDCQGTMKDGNNEYDLVKRAEGAKYTWACMASTSSGDYSSKWTALESNLPWCIYKLRSTVTPGKCSDLLPGDMVTGNKLAVSGGTKCTDQDSKDGKCTVTCSTGYSSSGPSVACVLDPTQYGNTIPAANSGKPEWRLTNGCQKECPADVPSGGTYNAITCTNKKVGDMCEEDKAKTKCKDTNGVYKQCGEWQCVNSAWVLTDASKAVAKQPRCWKQCDCKTLSGSSAFDKAATWRSLKTSCSATKWFPHGTTPSSNDFTITNSNDCEVKINIVCYDGTWMNLNTNGLAQFNAWTASETGCKQPPPTPPPTTKECTRDSLLDLINADAGKNFLKGTSIKDVGTVCTKDKYGDTEVVSFNCKPGYGVGGTGAGTFTCNGKGTATWVIDGHCKPFSCPALVASKAEMSTRYKGATGNTVDEKTELCASGKVDGDKCDFKCAAGLVKFWQRMDGGGGIKKDSWWNNGPTCQVTDTSAQWINIPYCVDPCLGVGDAASTTTQISTAALTADLEACPRNWQNLCDGFCTWAVTGAAELRGDHCNSLSCGRREVCKPPTVTEKSYFMPTKLCVQWTSNRYLPSSSWVEIKDGTDKTIGARFLYKSITEAMGTQSPSRTSITNLPFPAQYGGAYTATDFADGQLMTDINVGFNTLPRDIKFTPAEFQTGNGVSLFAGGNPSATIHYDLRSVDNSLGTDKLCGDGNPCENTRYFKMMKTGFTAACANKGCSCDDWMDGYCDPSCNNDVCGWDGGDCGCQARPEALGAVRGAKMPTDGLVVRTAPTGKVTVECPTNYIFGSTTPETDQGSSSSGDVMCAKAWNDVNGGVWEDRVCWAPCYSAAPQFDESLSSSGCALPTADTPSKMHGGSCQMTCPSSRTLEIVAAAGLSVGLANEASAWCFDGRYKYSAQLAVPTKTETAKTTYTPLNQWYCMDKCETTKVGSLPWAKKDGWLGKDATSNLDTFFNCADTRITVGMCTPKCSDGYVPNGKAQCTAKETTNFALKRNHEVEWKFVRDPKFPTATSFECVKIGTTTGKCDFSTYYKYPQGWTGSFAWLDAPHSGTSNDPTCVVDKNGKVPSGSYCLMVCDTPEYRAVGYPCPWLGESNPARCARCNDQGQWEGKTFCQAPCKVAPRFFGYDSKTAATSCIPSQPVDQVMARSSNPPWIPLGGACDVTCDATKGYNKLDDLNLMPAGATIPDVCAWRPPKCIQGRDPTAGATGNCAGGSSECVKSNNMTFNQFRSWDVSSARCFASCSWAQVQNKPTNVAGCVEGDVVKHGGICTPKCSDNFKMISAAMPPAVPLWCNNGTWAGSWAGSCKMSTSDTCDSAMLEDVFNAFPLYSLDNPDVANRFKCKQDRMLPEGIYRVKCLDFARFHPHTSYKPEYMLVTCSKGKWFYNDLNYPPKCDAIKSCPPIVDTDVGGNLLGDKQCEGTKDGQDCQVKCDPGYTVQWPNQDYGPICKNGKWKNMVKCVQACEYAGCDKWKNSEHFCNGVCDSWVTDSSRPNAKNCAGPSCSYDNNCNKTVVNNVNIQVAKVFVRFDSNQKLTDKAWVGLFGTDEKDGWEKYRWVNKKQAFNVESVNLKSSGIDTKTGQPQYSYEFQVDIQLDSGEPNNGRIFPDWGGRQSDKTGNGKVQLLSFDEGILGWAEDADARRAVKDLQVGVFADGANKELANADELPASSLCDYKEKCFDMGLCPSIPATPIPEPSPPDFDVPAQPVPTVPTPPSPPQAPLVPSATSTDNPTTDNNPTTDTSVNPSPVPSAATKLEEVESARDTWRVVGIIFIVLTGIFLLVVIILIVLLLSRSGGGKDTNYHQL